MKKVRLETRLQTLKKNRSAIEDVISDYANKVQQKLDDAEEELVKLLWKHCGEKLEIYLPLPVANYCTITADDVGNLRIRDSSGQFIVEHEYDLILSVFAEIFSDEK